MARYGGAATRAERSATAVCTLQLFGAVWQRQGLWSALGEKPLGVGFPVSRCWRAMRKLGGVRASINSVSLEKVSLTTL